MITIRTAMLATLCSSLIGLAAGCMDASTDGDELISEDELADTSAELASCSGASCDGLNPNTTGCNDGLTTIVAGSGVFDSAGRQIGGLALYYSPTCKTVWGATAFYQPQSHRTCAVRVDPVSNAAICTDYVGSFGNISPMRHLGVGKTGFGRTVVNGTITARTPDYTRTF